MNGTKFWQLIKCYQGVSPSMRYNLSGNLTSSFETISKVSCIKYSEAICCYSVLLLFCQFHLIAVIIFFIHCLTFSGGNYDVQCGKFKVMHCCSSFGQAVTPIRLQLQMASNPHKIQVITKELEQIHGGHDIHSFWILYLQWC